MKTKILFLLSVVLQISASLFAQAGKVDSSFGTSGFVRFNPETYSTGSFSAANAIAVNENNGKIILGGYGYEGSNDKQYQTLVRLKPNGTIDTKFGINGSVNYQPVTDAATTYFYGIQSLALQHDNKILIAASYYYSTDTVIIVLSRFNTDGTIDGGFGSYGSVYLKYPCFGLVTCGVAVQKDGKIVLASARYDENLYQTMIAWRFNSNGTPDLSFNGTGKADMSTYFPYWDISFCQVKIAANGKIILGGDGDSHGVTHRNFIIVRLQTNGTPDPNFGSSGIASGSFDTSHLLSCNAIAIENDADIIATGFKNGDKNYRFAFIDFKPNGLLNKTFNKTGKLLLPASFAGITKGIGVQKDGKIVACGSQYTYGQYLHAILLRLNRYGTFDSSFGKNGVVTPDSTITTGYKALDFDSSGKIVCTANVSLIGYNVFGASRYLNDAQPLAFANSDAANTTDASVAKQAPATGLSLSINPNPVQKNGVLNYSINNDDNITISLYNLNGKVVQTILSGAARLKGYYSQSFSLPESILPGNYMVLLTSKTQRVSAMLVKQ